MIDSDRFVTNFGPKNHATWPFLSMPWAVIRGWAIIQVWAINREFTVHAIFSQRNRNMYHHFLQMWKSRAVVKRAICCGGHSGVNDICCH